MRKILCLIFIALIFSSCSSTYKRSDKRCKSVLRNDYKNIIEGKLKSLVKKDTLLLNEIRYECTYTAFYIQKGMYDKYGKWNEKIYRGNSHSPILFWEKVQLFPNDTTTFIIAANGLESWKTTYASVLVFDWQNKDMLAENSKYKSKLVNYFSEMIKNNNPKKKDFYEVYWKMVDPTRWEKIKKYQKNK